MGDFWEENIFKAVTQIRRYFFVPGRLERIKQARRHSGAQRSTAERRKEQRKEQSGDCTNWQGGFWLDLANAGHRRCYPEASWVN